MHRPFAPLRVTRAVSDPRFPPKDGSASGGKAFGDDKIQMTNLNKLRQRLRRRANPKRALVLKSFFKTGPGEYGEGDVFIGIDVPTLRSIAKRFACLKLPDLAALLASNIHEERLIALLILVNQYQKAPETQKKKIFNFYLRNLKFVNNWDLVDLTAPHLAGHYLCEIRARHSSTGSESRATSRDALPLLTRLARSKNLWERRVSIVSTLYFIRKGDSAHVRRIAKMLLNDSHDLIHKAAGWMLREMGKRDQSVLEKFLGKHAHQMPRTMLRYAIERFPENKRKKYLNGATVLQQR